MCPAMITIADSTQLTRAIRGEDDDFTGGNFTPACLAFLVNYMVEKIEEVYGRVWLSTIMFYMKFNHVINYSTF